MDLLFQKGNTGLVPACEEAREWLSKKRTGATILVSPREPRNGAFFRKWWALVDLAYQYWSDSVELPTHKGREVLPSFERFRKDVTILAGYYDVVVNIKGETRLEAQSLQWAKMGEPEFTKLYDATICALLRQVFNGQTCQKWSEEELRSLVDQIEEFAA